MIMFTVKACPICFGNGETQEKALKKCDQNTKYQTCPPDLPLPVCVTKDIKTGSVLQLMAHEVTRQCLSSIGFDQSSFGYQEHICLEAMRNRGNNKLCVIGKCDEDRCKAEIPDLD